MELGKIFEQFGLPIGMLIAIVAGRFVPGFIYFERKKEVADRDEEIKRLNTYVISELSPALTRQAEVVERAMKMLSEMHTERKLQEQLERLERRHDLQDERRWAREDPGR
jgi:hypothetical protein